MAEALKPLTAPRPFRVRVHETVISRRVREIEITIPAKNADHARQLAQVCYPGMLPPDAGIRVITDSETHEQSHQAGAGVVVEEPERG